MKYHIQYKCRLCGNLITVDESHEFATQDDCLEALKHISSETQSLTVEGREYPLVISHSCSNSCYGYADIVGLAIMQTCDNCQYTDNNVYFDPVSKQQSLYKCIKDGKFRPGSTRCDKNDVIM